MRLVNWCNSEAVTQRNPQSGHCQVPSERRRPWIGILYHYPDALHGKRAKDVTVECRESFGRMMSGEGFEEIIIRQSGYIVTQVKSYQFDG